MIDFFFFFQKFVCMLTKGYLLYLFDFVSFSFLSSCNKKNLKLIFGSNSTTKKLRFRSVPEEN